MDIIGAFDLQCGEKRCRAREKIWNALVSATFQPMWHNLFYVHYYWLKNLEWRRGEFISKPTKNTWENIKDKILIEI